MKKIVLSTMAIFSIGLGFANPPDTVPEPRSTMIEAGDIGDEAPSTGKPVLEKCKKKRG